MITAFRAIAAEKSGIITAEVTSAVALKPAQHKDLEAALGATLGGDVKIAALRRTRLSSEGSWSRSAAA